MNKDFLSQDWINRHYRGYITRDGAFLATKMYLKKNLDIGYITQEEYDLAMERNQIAYDNNAQDKPSE